MRRIHIGDCEKHVCLDTNDEADFEIPRRAASMRETSREAKTQKNARA